MSAPLDLFRHVVLQPNAAILHYYLEYQGLGSIMFFRPGTQFVCLYGPARFRLPRSLEASTLLYSVLVRRTGTWHCVLRLLLLLPKRSRLEPPSPLIYLKFRLLFDNGGGGRKHGRAHKQPPMPLHYSTTVVPPPQALAAPRAPIALTASTS